MNYPIYMNRKASFFYHCLVKYELDYISGCPPPNPTPSFSVSLISTAFDGTERKSPLVASG